MKLHNPDKSNMSIGLILIFSFHLKYIASLNETSNFPSAKFLHKFNFKSVTAYQRFKPFIPVIRF